MKNRQKLETKQDKKQRYNLHYKLRKHGYTIRLKDRHIIRPETTTTTTIRWEKILTTHDHYSISEALL